MTTGHLQYTIRHTNRFTYSVPISESMMEVRMQPRGDGRQRCMRFEVTTQPRARVLAYQDPLGNVVHHFDIPSSHGRLTIVADAVIDMAPGIPLPEGLSDEAWDDLDSSARIMEEWESLQFSRFARDTPLLADLAHDIGWRRDADPLTMMRRLNAALFEKFTYAPRSTNVDSPIDEALQARGGVCQDFAHIMIALARRVGIPCRYVSGYLSPSAESLDRSAEGATHAWAEAYLPGIGWAGFDPTNNVLAEERHVRVAIGRDYADVPPTRGVFRGEASSELGVLVTITLADAPIRPEKVMPMTIWVSSEEIKPLETFDEMQQQQQQQ